MRPSSFLNLVTRLLLRLENSIHYPGGRRATSTSCKVALHLEFKAPALQPHCRLAAPSPLALLPPSPPSWAYTMSGIRAGTELGT